MKRKLDVMSGSNKKCSAKTEPPKISVTTEKILSAVDRVVPANFFNFEMRVGTDQLQSNLIESSAEMENEKLTQCEMNVQLWEAALFSALRDTSSQTYPHYSIVQSLLNYIMNDYNGTDFGLTSEMLSRLLKFHPPSCSKMNEYYHHILEDKYVSIYKKSVEDEPFFWIVVGFFLSLPSDCILPSEKIDWVVPADPHNDLVEATLVSLKPTEENLEALVEPKDVTYFNDLPFEDKLLRCNICLKFICDLLDGDAIACFKSNKKTKKQNCLLSSLLWSDGREKGSLNKNVLKIIGLQRLTKSDGAGFQLKRLVALTAELIRTTDRLVELNYPFFGSNSLNYARELALLLLEGFRSGKTFSFGLLLQLSLIGPPWLRLLVSSHILGSLAGFQCTPQLLSAETVLEYVVQIYRVGRHEKRTKENVNTEPADPVLVAKFAKLKSVNSKLVSGFSRLHIACRQNKAEVVRALTTFPTLDLNQIDNDGWTALHHAAAKGHDACVVELLSYTPKLMEVQGRVDTRARGPGNWTPIMRAVEGDHVGTCKLLLQHTGSVLLEDINDYNETCMDLSSSSDIKALLQYYSKNKVETIHSRKDLHLTTTDLPLIVRLCYIFVESYMATHRTWDVYHEVKRSIRTDSNTNGPKKKIDILCEYSRYHRDFKSNLEKMRSLVAKLKKVADISSIVEDFTCMVSLNKN